MNAATISGGVSRGWRVLAACVLLLAGCANTPRLGTTAASFMNHARENVDPNMRHQAYARLADAYCYDHDGQRAEAATFLASRLDERQEPTVTRAVICRTLGEIGRPEARESLRRACDDPDPVVRAAACRALGKLRDPEDAAVLARIMAADQDADCRIAAIEGLGALKVSDERIAITLIDGMENPDPAVRLASYEALQRITGRDLGVEASAWKKGLLAEGAGDAGPPGTDLQTGQAAPDGATMVGP